MNTRPIKLNICFFLLIFSLISVDAVALSFKPTETEWAGWGEMCRARYVVSGAGLSNEFRTRVPISRVKHWETKIGAQAWSGLHHYCAGIILEDRRGNPKAAISEYMYTLERTPQSHSNYGIIISRLANANYKIGETALALRYANQAITVNPSASTGYIVKGILQRKEGALNDAIKTLKTGNKASQGRSSELNYHLGLAYFSIGNFEEAKKYASIAYELGYPLPWLRDQLVSKKMWD